MNKLNKIIFMMMVSAPFATHADNHATGKDGETCSSSKKEKDNKKEKSSSQKRGMHQIWKPEYQNKSDQKNNENKS